MTEANFKVQVKKKIADIEVFEKIGEGGQKKVYKCKYQDEIRVIKFIKINDKDSIERARRELEIAESLKSKFFPKVQVHGDFSLDSDDYLFVIEEYIEGENLRDYLSHQNLDEKSSLNIGISLLKALAVVHSKNLVHRDIKPENIMLDNENVILLDFGIARDLTKESLTADVAFWGPMTVGYAAPEQIKNQKKIICNRTDIFSWGVLMYEIITGIHPFRIKGLSVIDVIEKTLNDEVSPMNTGNKVLDDLVLKSLNKVLHRRPVSVEKMIEKLEGGNL